ncbi:hypothetical protein [Klebsiella aerogenes]|uniref:hypothetical protein n=1 Tax=Klebsiella aerogenes TaxID=548 RepID=UPI00292E4D26|nr:hypothetical protein [Klebsiella aerogenes]
MLDGKEAAKLEIEKSIFLRKASPWVYENEWRMISNVGLQNASIYLSDVIFGFRCKDTTIYTVMKALEGRTQPIDFWQMTETPNEFTLTKIKTCLGDEEFSYYPRCLDGVAEFLDHD